MKFSLQSIIAPSLPLTLVIYLASFGLWMAFYGLYASPPPMRGLAGSYAETWLSAHSLVAHVFTFGIVVLNSLVIAQMNNRFALIRTRTFIPTFVYLLLSVCWLPAYGNYVAALGAFCVLIALYFALGMYKNENSVEQAFLSFLFLALGTFFVHEFAPLILVFWIGFLILNCFSTRVFFASLFGFLTPCVLFVATHFLLFDHFELLPEVHRFVMRYTVFDYRNIPAFVYAAVMLFILVCALLQIAANNRQYSIQTRKMLSFFRVIIFALLLLFLFRHLGLVSYLPLAAILYALITAHIFTLFHHLFNTILFVALCVVNFAFVFYILII